MSDRLAPHDVLFPLDAVGSQLVGPRNDQGGNEAEADQQHQRLQYPVRRVNAVEDQVGYLQEHPRGNDVGNTYAKHVPALKFLEKAHAVAVFSRCEILSYRIVGSNGHSLPSASAERSPMPSDVGVRIASLA